MNTRPAQPIPGNGQHPDQQCYDKLDCPDQAMTAINAAQLAHIAELLDLLDGFLRRAECGSPEIVEGFLCRFRLGLGFPDLVVDG